MVEANRDENLVHELLSEPLWQKVRPVAHVVDPVERREQNDQLDLKVGSGFEQDCEKSKDDSPEEKDWDEVQVCLIVLNSYTVY